MFHIKLIPQVNESLVTPDISVSGDVLTVGGEAFDFSPLGEGESITSDAVENAHIQDAPQTGDTNAIHRKDGNIYLGIKYPVFWNSPEAARFPNPDVVSISSGSVPLPDPTPDPTVQPVQGLSLGEVLNIAAALQQAGIGVQTDEQQQ